MGVHVFGIRHHGPGCARSLVAALSALKPDVVLVEGPPDADDVLPLRGETGLELPVALLVYPPDEPRRGVFYPFAVFSPEWQALEYARVQNVPARFMDLPIRHRLEHEEVITPTEELYDDPVGELSRAAGYDDRELWWEHQVEQRREPAGLFQGILEAMTEVRQHAENRPERKLLPLEAEREAWMRQTIRQAQKDGFERIAVVCGDWHAPTLAHLGPANADADRLKGLSKTKVVATWVPWSYDRLAAESGYGAGVRSPGWYEHLWNHPRDPAPRWATRAARLLRDEDFDASSASVIETVRLGEALAAIRGLPLPGLAELNDATRAVLCHGNRERLDLIRRRLEIGAKIGSVPPSVPAVPLQNDLEEQQKRLRLKATAEVKTLDLDLRKDIDRERSRLLHRLNVLDIPWGNLQPVRGQAGTFHELWQIQWQVEYSVNVIAAARWGGTVAEAATNCLRTSADDAKELPELTVLLDRAILAELPVAAEHVLTRLDAVAAVSADVRHLADALPPLTRVARYGDVRGTDAAKVLPVVRGFVARIIVGLAAASSAIDDEAAGQLAESYTHVHTSLELLEQAELRADWSATLTALLDNDAVHPQLRGYATRLLVEQQQLADEDLFRWARLALSPCVAPTDATGWLTGLLRGSGLVLLHRDNLWQMLDAWLIELPEQSFVEQLPMLRKAFSIFQPPERRSMGDKVKHLRQSVKSTAPQLSDDIDHDRAQLVLPVLAHILGVTLSEGDQ